MCAPKGTCASTPFSWSIAQASTCSLRARALRLSPDAGVLAGGSLLDILNSRMPLRPFTEEEALWTLADVCNGVAVLHGHTPPIVHRDIKARSSTTHAASLAAPRIVPYAVQWRDSHLSRGGQIENVLLHESGAFKLCDFGSCLRSHSPEVLRASLAQLRLMRHSRCATGMSRQWVRMRKSRSVTPPMRTVHLSWRTRIWDGQCRTRCTAAVRPAPHLSSPQRAASLPERCMGAGVPLVQTVAPAHPIRDAGR